jgi:fluoroacetyl-CoA thioesterase
VNAQRREISFEEVCTVDADQTARRLFARLSHGSAYANQLVEGLATGYLIAIVESICIREMLREMSLTTEVIVGAAVNIRHRAPVPPGKQVWLRGRTTHLGERKATFAVQACDDDEVVCEGTMTFVATSRERIETRLALKLGADSRASRGASKREQHGVVAHFDPGFTRIANAVVTPC